MSNRLNIAIIGAQGHFAFTTHATEALAARTNLVAVAGNEEERVKIASVFPEAKAREYETYGALFANETPDIVVVNPQYDQIAEAAITALTKGIPVYAEKPFALDEASLARLDDTWRTTGTPLLPMFDMRYNPLFSTARTLLRESAIGTPLLITAQKSYKLGTRPPFYAKRETFGGIIPWVGIHAIDFVRFVTDVTYASVFATQTTRGNKGQGTLETAALMLFDTKEGALVEVNVDYLRAEKAATHGDDRLRIAGSEGTLEIAGGVLTLANAEGERVITPNEYASRMFDDVVAYLLEGKDALATAEDGFYATHVALASRKSADEKRKVTLDSAFGL